MVVCVSEFEFLWFVSNHFQFTMSLLNIKLVIKFTQLGYFVASVLILSAWPPLSAWPNG
jgi:hypothetical protein